MKTVVVTGAAGMIGGAVLEELSKDNDVRIVALSRSDRSGGGSAGDIVWKKTDYSQADLEKILDGADAVVHLAGVKGDKTELSDFDGDILMTENILKAMETCGVRRMIYSSSRLVYADPKTIPWTEDTPPKPASAYGINKLRTEDLCREHCEKNGLQITAVRIAQVISENDRFRNMINVFRDLSIEGRPLTVIGKSVAKRQYLYAGDLAKIIHILISDGHDGFTLMNAGMIQSYTNLEIAEAFGKAYGNDAPVSYDDSKPETITDSVMDVSRMIGMTGFTPMDMARSLEEMAKKAARI
ncbi:MAG: NAD(P)-dependent oxidoreductase [Mogibacterium sp.]|nr:NAD(P)-dependent oxidoreductase [Mogibacterium sp.]